MLAAVAASLASSEDSKEASSTPSIEEEKVANVASCNLSMRGPREAMMGTKFGSGFFFIGSSNFFKRSLFQVFSFARRSREGLI